MGKFRTLVTDASRLGFDARTALRGAVGLVGDAFNEADHPRKGGKFASATSQHKKLLKGGYSFVKAAPSNHAANGAVNHYSHPQGGGATIHHTGPESEGKTAFHAK